jgi:hypothetical protein
MHYAFLDGHFALEGEDIPKDKNQNSLPAIKACAANGVCTLSCTRLWRCRYIGSSINSFQILLKCRMQNYTDTRCHASESSYSSGGMHHV